MLTQLCIDNFALAKSLEIEYDKGMTVITGETGAGKSLTLDALEAVSGGRVDAKLIRNGCKQADIHACFDISTNKAAQAWLCEQDLGTDDCLLRRIINTSGRNKAYINGRPATVVQLRELGALLIDIHSQNQHYSLLQKTSQRELLDDYAGNEPLITDIKQYYSEISTLNKQLQNCIDNSEEQTAREQLLRYQVEELDQLALAEHELEQLEQEQTQLANADEILQACFHSQQLCDDGNTGLLSQLHQVSSALSTIQQPSSSLQEALEMINSAHIIVGEASDAINHHINHQPNDPERLESVEQRLSSVYQIARKHRVEAYQLYEKHQQLSEELVQLFGGEEQIEQLRQQIVALQERYDATADKLTNNRRRHGKKLCTSVNKQLQALGMQHCKIEFALISCDRSLHGREAIELLVSTNPGQPAAAIAKIASGGELSRISLAISVVATGKKSPPTLIFDEVDAGIGGGVAEVVGRLLRELSQSSQVICITHLPQVASQGHQHYFAHKIADRKSAHSEIISLNKDDKVEEVARMLGGIAITQQTRAHAREMLTTQHA
ncbi:DNA repair protein RecN [Sinobacterium norvegicum]|uniref:DNA repair protein RecN n=1 Tax=Sinobacterium norvegicum TaxID=1641715 RepID=A0ABM9AGB2_9GAMM|nr:DNA repair protein RecN [Sinobacterium norvegicum]CAH0992224.1 DNA repair protein RecN [Sinobacterium norvegicum]